jgi:hypothetical protein
VKSNLPTVNSLVEFVTSINGKIGINLPKEWAKLPEIEIARRFLSGVNEYFFQTHRDLGTTTFQDQEFQYFSAFHKFWEAHHEKILNVRVDSSRTKITAKCLSRAISTYGREILDITTDTNGLSPKALAQVRFLTANQDFREPPKNQFAKYLKDPTRFEAPIVFEDPVAFLHFLGTTRLSQTDKRIDFARNAAGFLVANRIKAFQIAELFRNNAVEIRKALTNSPNMGYASKKANMFIRDMVELGVWPRLTHYDEIDVASDINTMKLALRTGILKTDIPLISSFLDIFCWQYECIDQLSAQAWRRVWEEWQSSDPKTAPRAPCLMDFLIYRIGREYCDDDVVQYECKKGHGFYHFGARLRNCKICIEHGERSPARPVSRFLPCQLRPQELPRENGILLLKQNNLLRTFDGVCIFEETCQPKSESFRALAPPKSISIKGQTSWTNSYADRERGGGGMMG